MDSICLNFAACRLKKSTASKCKLNNGIYLGSIDIYPIRFWLINWILITNERDVLRSKSLKSEDKVMNLVLQGMSIKQKHKMIVIL